MGNIIDSVVDSIINLMEPVMNLAIKYWYYIPFGLIAFFAAKKFGLF